MAKKEMVDGDYYAAFPLGKNLYRLIIRSAAGSSSLWIENIGSNVDTVFSVPWPFRLRKIAYVHTDSAGTLSTDAFTLEITENAFGSGAAGIMLWSPGDADQSSGILGLGEKYEEPGGATSFRVRSNTTNTDRMYVMFDIQVI